MGKSIREIEGFGASELSEWKAFWKHEPWGPYRDNLHAAIVAATLANIHRKPNTRPVPYEEFMLTDRDQYKKRKSKEFLSWMRSVAKAK